MLYASFHFFIYWRIFHSSASVCVYFGGRESFYEKILTSYDKRTRIFQIRLVAETFIDSSNKLVLFWFGLWRNK